MPDCSCLIHLKFEQTFNIDIALQTFHRPHLTHFLLKDTLRFVHRLLPLTMFLTRFHNLESIVMDIAEPISHRLRATSLGKLFAHHACGLKLLDFNCNGNALLLETVIQCNQMRQLTLMLRIRDNVESCKVSPKSVSLWLMARRMSAHRLFWYLLSHLHQLVTLSILHNEISVPLEDGTSVFKPADPISPSRQYYLPPSSMGTASVPSMDLCEAKYFVQECDVMDLVFEQPAPPPHGWYLLNSE